MAEEAIQQTNILEMVLKPYIDPTRLINKYNNAQSSRDQWNTTWQIIQDRVFPDYRDYVSGNVSYKSSPQKNKIKSHTAVVSALINKTVSLLISKTCDPAVRWLDLNFEEEAFNENFAVKDWLNQCREALYRLFARPKSCFYTSTFSLLLDWFTLGTACRQIVLRRDTGEIQFVTVPMQDVFVDVSGYGDIDVVYRRMQLTSHQALQLWGDALSPKM